MAFQTPRSSSYSLESPCPLVRHEKKTPMTLGWLRGGDRVVTGWLQDGYGVVTGWLQAGYRMITGWLGVVTGWLQDGYRMVTV